MEFVLHPSLPSQVILGPRVSPGVGNLVGQHQVQQVLTAIVKATFAEDDPNATPLPDDQQEPLFPLDVFFNLVRNGGFEDAEQRDPDTGNLLTPAAPWTSEGPAISRSDGPPKFLRLAGAGRVVQKLTFERSLGGRTFRLRFQARAGTATTVTGIQVESESGIIRFAGARSLSAGTFTTFSTLATWPAELEDTEATLVLIGSSTTTVDYAEVQLTEGSATFAFDPSDPIRYEHDLAPFKPRADVVVLGAPAPPEPGPDGGTWTEQVAIGSALMSASFSGGGRTTFGWEDRLSGTRNGYAGDAEGFDPETMLLPTGFNNLFLNGGLYQGTVQPRFSHPPAGATVSVRSSAQYTDGGTTQTRTRTRSLHLPAVGPTATVTYRTGTEPGSPTLSQPLDMRVDTIVHQKDTSRFYAVWRGVWDYASVPPDRYVSLVIA